MATEIPDEATLLQASVRVPDHVVLRDFGHETVLLNLETGRYHGLNPTAGRMLEVLGNSSALIEAADQLSEEFDVPADRLRQDLVDLCSKLLERDLLTLA